MPLQGQDPGTLDRRITIQTRSTNTDAYGAAVETWTDTVTVWAQVEYPKTGSGEQYYDNVAIASTAVIFTIRYRAIDPALNRIDYGGEVYDIERIAEIGRRNFTAITAKLRQNDGRTA